MSDYRAALNCSFRQQDEDVLCPRCGDPLRVHAPPGMALSDLGYIHGNHPAWVASTKDARTQRLYAWLGAETRRLYAESERIEISPGAAHGDGWIWFRCAIAAALRNYNVARAGEDADALRAEEGGEHG